MTTSTSTAYERSASRRRIYDIAIASSSGIAVTLGAFMLLGHGFGPKSSATMEITASADHVVGDRTTRGQETGRPELSKRKSSPAATTRFQIRSSDTGNDIAVSLLDDPRNASLAVAQTEPSFAKLSAAIESNDLKQLARHRTWLSLAVREDADLRQTAFREYLADPDSTLGTMLRHALSTGAAAELERLVEAAITVGSSRNERLAAISLLKELSTLSRDTRETLVLTIEDYPDADTVLGSLNALQRRGATEIGESTAIVNALMPLSRHDDEAVRAHSLRVLAQWSKSESVQSVLLDAARADTATGVRENAVDALGSWSHLPSETFDALVAMADDSTEADSVRKKAWRVLEKFPLPPDLISRYEAFMTAKREREREEQENYMSHTEVVAFDGAATFLCGPGEESLCE